MLLPKLGKGGNFSRAMAIILRTTAMNLRENGKRVYSRVKGFVSRNVITQAPFA
jgi:hypothetical protein